VTIFSWLSARILRNFLRKDLDCDVAVEAGVVGAIDLSHPAGADWFTNLVVAESRSSIELHGDLSKRLISKGASLFRSR
jgi:hypothetical protein